jgi:two-component system, chemotaxis family, protein-glutamate methylesterase/glutaminase
VTARVERSPTRVVVVEDSLVQRAHLVQVLEAEGDITVVGEATSATEAIEQVASLRPDVVTLDLNIPEGGGQHALEQIMASTPTPVLVLSSTVQNDASAPAIEALMAGALIAIPKPAHWTPIFENDLRRNVRTVRNVPVIRHPRPRTRNRQAPPMATTSAPHVQNPFANETDADLFMVAIAASTGGPPALATVLAGLAGLRAPVLIVQHIHPDFVQGLVDWMNRVSPLPVILATHGQRLRGGCVHIGPGGTHLRVGAGRKIELAERPVTAHCPSADQLFESVATHARDHGIGVVLTGMGDDGAKGLAAMHQRGARTIAQDEATCAVYGMPRAAKQLGAVDQQLPLADIATAIMRAARGRSVVTP